MSFFQNFFWQKIKSKPYLCFHSRLFLLSCFLLSHFLHDYFAWIEEAFLDHLKGHVLDNPSKDFMAEGASGHWIVSQVTEATVGRHLWCDGGHIGISPGGHFGGDEPGLITNYVNLILKFKVETFSQVWRESFGRTVYNVPGKRDGSCDWASDYNCALSVLFLLPFN